MAYLSADFGNHPVLLLMAGVFEMHNRDRFEVIAISCSTGDGSELRQRIEAAFDRFVDVSRLGDDEVAASLVDMKIDIAIDLMGHTSGSGPASSPDNLFR